MTEHSRLRRFMTHFWLWLAIAIIVFPIYLVFVASTHTSQEILSAPMPVTPGSHFFDNYARALGEGAENLGASALTMMKNWLIMALGIAVAKMVI